MAMRLAGLAVLLVAAAGCYAAHAGEDDWPGDDDGASAAEADSSPDLPDALEAETDPPAEADGDAAGDVRTCPPGEPEVCDDVDNNCDGLTDEDFDLRHDPENCGACGHRCALPSAYRECSDGECIRGCEGLDFYDCDGDRTNGCEYYCVPRVVPGECDSACVPTIPCGGCDTTCDGLDDDCNCAVDDCVDKRTDPENCGACGVRCRFPNAEGLCVDADCALGPCLPSFFDLNGDPADGCEVECGPADVTPPRPEVCNGVDDDCDTEVDEGDPGGGLPCGTGAGACRRGTTRCRDGSLACDGAIGPAPETCNAVDDDCDGATDEALPLGPPCGVSVGACEPGHLECAGGRMHCVGGIWPSPEICNCADDNCDGATDEETACPAGTACAACSCAEPCDPLAGLPCPVGAICDCSGLVPEDPTRCFCVDP